jgi:hypothetical protein
MAIRKVWLGSTGPFLYDDSVFYIDPENTIWPDTQQGIATDGQLVVLSPPSVHVHVIRKFELDNAMVELDAQLDTLAARVDALTARVDALAARSTSGALTLTAAGFSPGPLPITGGFSKNGSLVTIFLPAMSGGSLQPYLRIGGIPANLFPMFASGGSPVVCYSEPGGYQLGTTRLYDGTPGALHTIELLRATDPAWPTTGARATGACMFTYSTQLV